MAKIPTQKEVQDAHEKEHFPKSRRDVLAKLRDQSERIMTPKALEPPTTKTPRLDALIQKVEDQAHAIMVLAQQIELMSETIKAIESQISPAKEPSNV